MANDRRGTLPTTDKGWQAYLQNIKAPAARQWIALGGGLVVCLEASGTKTFQVRVRRQGDENARRIVIGHFPASSVADARRAMSEIKAIAKEGRDPALERRRAKAGITEVRILGDLVDTYLARRKGDIAAKSLQSEREQLHILRDAIGDRLLADIEPRDISNVVESYARRLRKAGRSSGTSANRLLGATKRMFKMAKGWGLITRDNPAADLTRPAKEVPRQRVLVDGRVLVSELDPATNEVGKLIMALCAEPAEIPVSRPLRIAIHLCLLLGVRALEACSLEWSAVRLDDNLPTLVVTRSKTKAGHRTLPLSPQAVALLRERRASASRKDRFVFPAEKGAKRADHLHPESLSRAFSRACDRLHIADATLHDLRRTCLSGLIELGYGEIAERVAGHTAKTVLGRHYDRSNRLDSMSAALTVWADAIDAAVQSAMSSKPLSLPAPANLTEGDTGMTAR
jgi:integrase